MWAVLVPSAVVEGVPWPAWLLVVAGILDVPWGVEASPLHLSLAFSPCVRLSLCLEFLLFTGYQSFG